MTGYIIRRLIYGVLVMLAVTTLVFFFIRAVPGDPVRAMVGFESDPAAVQKSKKNGDLTSQFTFSTVCGFGTCFGGISVLLYG